MTVFTSAMQCAPVDNQADMDGITSDPCDENTVITERLSAAPEHNITAVTGQEVITTFVVSGLVYLDAENVPVVKNH